MASTPSGLTETEDEAIVFGTVAYGESDLIVRLYSQHNGRFSLFARGAKKSRKRFPSGISFLSRGLIRWKTRRGDGLGELLETDFRGGFEGIGTDPYSYGRAAYIVEILERLTPEAEPDSVTFQVLTTILSALACHEADSRHLRVFELLLLKQTGYLPDELNGAPGVSGIAAFDPQTGAFSMEREPGMLPFTDADRNAAIALLSAPLDELPAIDSHCLKAISRLFAAHLRQMDVWPLKSMTFWRSLSHGVKP